MIKWIGELLAAFVLPLFTKAWSYLTGLIEDASAKKQSTDKATQADNKMEQAKTAEEIDKAADDVLDGI